ncbi:unnamed protein product, partial [Meganyctiphanes norvegica]
MRDIVDPSRPKVIPGVGDPLNILGAKCKLCDDLCHFYNGRQRDASRKEVVPTLANLGGQLGAALGTRDRMMMVMKRLDELQRYLDPTYGESLELSDNVKLDLVLNREEQLQQQHQQLNKMHELKHVLDSEHISDAASLSDQLIQVANAHAQQEDAASRQAADINNMLDQYNSIVSFII